MGDAVFPAVLGETFRELPAPLQELHRGECSSDWKGSASVQGADNVVGRLVAALIGFPADSRRSEVRVSIEVARKGETWTRSIGNRRFRSHLSVGAGREAGLLCERFGVITVATAIAWTDEKLRFVPVRWRIGPLPLPRALLPKGNSFEHERGGAFAFDVRVETPVLGLIAAYEGTLRPQSGSRDATTRD